MVLLNLAAAIRLGLSQDSSITPRGLFPQPNPADGGPSVQASWVYFSIKVRVLVRLTSPRTFSSRQGDGVLRDCVQFKFVQGSESVGAGYWVINKRACAVSRACGMTSGTLGPPAPTVKGPPSSAGFGSVSPAEGKKEQPATLLKSPVRSARPGT